ncbi:MAG TPA: CBS domain-containing protein [Verrucomicrobiae bacterium]|nr:CBS domain-containing protein [Verrucomicrobiae bacterium]
MIVGMYMTRNVEVISPAASLVEGIRKMARRRIRRLVVQQGTSILGMVTYRDIVEAFPPHVNPFSVIGIKPGEIAGTIATIMKRTVISVDEGEPIEYAAELMTRHHIGCLPVTRHGLLVGIITESDIFRAFSRMLANFEGAVRITFDLTEREKVLTFLEEATHDLDLELLSFLTFRDDNRRMAVARVQGAKIDRFIDKLWESGHSVVNVLRPGAHHES